VVLALLRWGLTRTWYILTFWRSERKKPMADRQSIDRMKALAGLVAIAAALGIAAWFVLGMTMSVASFFLSRQVALYIGAALVIVGLQVARMMPRRRVLGLVLAGLGAILCAYGLGYFG
jgi:hypothetical protein